MKKIIIIPIIIIILIGLLLIPKNKKEETTSSITIAEVTHSVFYTPFYVAIENGYFKEENINIDLILTPGADKVSSAVIAGDAQIGLAGAESAIYILKQDAKDYLQTFCGLTKRDGQFLMGREKIDNFTLNDLKGKEILVGRKSGMPALNFLNALKKSNINPNDIKINYSIDFASLTGAFIGKTGDFVNLFENSAKIITPSILKKIANKTRKLNFNTRIYLIFHYISSCASCVITSFKFIVFSHKNLLIIHT